MAQQRGCRGGGACFGGGLAGMRGGGRAGGTMGGL